MKKIQLLSVLAVLSFSALVQAQSVNPVILRSGEEIVFRGNKWDSVSCNRKIYQNHDISIVVTEMKSECSSKCDTPKLARIYEDGRLKGLCEEEYTISQPDMSQQSFLDVSLIEKLSDAEVVKLMNSARIGSCDLYGQRLQNPQSIRDVFDSYVVSAQDELRERNENSPKIYLKAARNFIKDGFCGTSDNLTPKQLSSTRKVLGQLDIGFDLMIKEGARGEDLVAMKYPAKKILAKFNISAESFKKAGYSARDLKDAGFSFKDLLNAKYTVNDMYNGGVSVKELKAQFSPKELMSAGVSASDMKTEGFVAKDLAAAGYSLKSLIDGGYDVKKDLRSIFTIQDFMAIKGSYGSRFYGNDYLKDTAGFSAKEMKDAGISVLELQNAGFQMREELKPIFTLKDFMAVKGSYGSRYYSTDYLKNNLGYSAAELKAEGISITELQNAGFGMKEDVKPLYTLKDFIAVKGSYGSRFYSTDYLKDTLGYSAAELKEAGIPLTELQNAGFRMKEDLKPLYSLKDFMAVKGNYGSRFYSTDYLKDTLGYSAKELKAEGVSITELQNSGFNMREEVKPLFTLKDFMAVKGNYGSRFYSTDYLKDTLGYTAAELKAEGISITELQNAGFKMREEIKPLYSVQEFMAVKGNYGSRFYSTSDLKDTIGFSAWDLKEAGISIKELYNAGFTKAQLREAGFTVTDTDAL